MIAIERNTGQRVHAGYTRLLEHEAKWFCVLINEFRLRMCLEMPAKTMDELRLPM